MKNDLMKNLWMSMSNQDQGPLMLNAPVPQDAPPAQAAQMQMSTKATDFMPQDKYDMLLNRMEQKSLAGIEAQKKSAAELLKYKQQLIDGHHDQVDLSPLMALADSWTGSHLSQGYQRPETQAELKHKLMQVEQAHGAAQGKISDDELSLLKTQLMGQLSKDKLAAASGKNPLDELNGEGKKFIGLANSGVQSIAGMEQSIKNGIGPERINSNTPLIGTFQSDNAFTEHQRNAAEMFGRIQSGGAINKDEEARFIAMGPRPGDTPEIMKEKLANQKAMLLDRMKIYGITPEHLEAAGVNNQQRSIESTGRKAPAKMSFEEWKKSKGY